MRHENPFRLLGESILAAFDEGKGGCGTRNRACYNEGRMGVPLSELEMPKKAPRRLKLAMKSADQVTIKKGKTLAIRVIGDSEEKSTRFWIADNCLSVFSHGRDQADPVTIEITIPKPRRIELLGGGQVVSKTMAKNAEIVIRGSGRMRIKKLDGKRLHAVITGSGRVAAKGAVDELKLSFSGASKFSGRRLEVQSADMVLRGAADVEFCSDGALLGTVFGSGVVTVHGEPTRNMKVFGSLGFNAFPRKGKNFEQNEASPGEV